MCPLYSGILAYITRD